MIELSCHWPVGRAALQRWAPRRDVMAALAASDEGRDRPLLYGRPAAQGRVQPLTKVRNRPKAVP